MINGYYCTNVFSKQAKAMIEFYRRVLDEENKDHLISNILGHIVNANENIQYRQCALFYKADKDYGTRIANGLNLNIDKVVELSEMSQEERVKATL